MRRCQRVFEPAHASPIQMTDENRSWNPQAESYRTYAAKAFGPESPGTPVSGKVRIEMGEVRLIESKINLSMPLEGLSLEMGGWDLSQAVVTHSDRPGWSVHVTDLEFLKDPSLDAYPALKAKARGVAKKQGGGNKIWIAAAAVCLLCVIPIILLMMNRARLARAVAEKVPVEWERQLGEQVFGQVRAKGEIVSDPEALAKLRRITTPLLKGIPEMRFSFQFHVSKDTNINAFALPGGHVVVNLGLLNAARRPEEVAGVLAHEIAHVTQRHGIRNLIESAGLSLLLQAVVGDQSGLLGAVLSGSEFLLQKKYSRDFEREADDVGWDYLIKAKIDPRGLIDFFSLLTELEKGSAALSAMNGAMNLASTHPASQERIDRLEAKWKAMPKGSVFQPLSRD